MFRDCIALAVYSDSWATMDTASESGVRRTVRAIPQSIKIINLIHTIFLDWSPISYYFFFIFWISCWGYNKWSIWLCMAHDFLLMCPFYYVLKILHCHELCKDCIGVRLLKPTGYHVQRNLLQGIPTIF